MKINEKFTSYLKMTFYVYATHATYAWLKQREKIRIHSYENWYSLEKSLKGEHNTCSFLPCLTIYYFSLARMDLISKKGQFSFPSQAEGIFPGKKLNPDFDLRIETLNLDFIFFVHYFKGFSISKTPTTTYDSPKKLDICFFC